MASTRPPTSKSSSPFNNPLVTVLKAPVMIAVIVTFMFNNVFSSLAKSRYLSFFSLSFRFIQWSAGTVHNYASSLFMLLIIIRSGVLAKIRWSVCMSKSLRSLCVILQDRCWFVHIPFVRMVKFKFLAHLPVDHLADLVVSSLIFLLRWFAAFAYYVIGGFICHCLAYICYFVAFNLFPLWYDLFLWLCFALLLGEILFLS